MQAVRHGDVDFLPIDKLPGKLRKLDTNIVAYGEMTGHNHSLVKVKENQFDLLEDKDGNKFLLVLEATEITHQEHATRVILPGQYQIKIEREYNPFDQKINEVKD